MAKDPSSLPSVKTNEHINHVFHTRSGPAQETHRSAVGSSRNLEMETLRPWKEDCLEWLHDHQREANVEEVLLAAGLTQ